MRRCKCGCKAELPSAARCKLIEDPIERLLKMKGYVSEVHAAAHAKAKREAKEAKLAAENKAWSESIPKGKKAAKEFIKTDMDLKKEAQKAFNAFIRARDHDQMCISCDKSIEDIQGKDGWKPGGAWDCGHYLTVGAHEELRFEELNASRQCKSCNAGSGKFTKKNGTVGIRYREKLIVKIGLDKVLWLEGPHEPKRYRAEDYRAIRAKYKALVKALV